MPRPRRDWTDYPSAFLEVLNHFTNSKEPTEIKFSSKHQFFAHRTQFYRFFAAIRDAFRAGGGHSPEVVACGLADAYRICNNILIHSDAANSRLVFELSDLADEVQGSLAEAAIPSITTLANKS